MAVAVAAGLLLLLAHRQVEWVSVLHDLLRPAAYVAGRVAHSHRALPWLLEERAVPLVRFAGLFGSKWRVNRACKF